MFFLRHKTNIVDTGFFSGFTDFHAHILPGVDDGVKRPEEALSILSLYKQLGIKQVYFTPHLMRDIANASLNLTAAFENFTLQYRGAVKLFLAGEYMLDGGYMKHLNAGLLCYPNRRVLTETSYMQAPVNMLEMLYSTSLTGYQPVIAHPERYMYMSDSNYRALKRYGYAFQLNLFSLAGLYGPRVMANANTLLEQGLYDLIGTDIHSLSSFSSTLHTFSVTSLQKRMLMALVR